MNLTELKKNSIAELLAIAKEMGLDNMARSRKQDIIFAILKTHARNGEAIYGDGVLEVLPDGFGFLRSSEGSYLAGPDDIYVSPSGFAVLVSRLATVSLGRFAHQKILNVILRY